MVVVCVYQVLERKLEQTFRVATDSPEDGPVTVRECDYLPKLGSILKPVVKGQARCECHSITYTRDPDNPQMWTVVCRYRPTTLCGWPIIWAKKIKSCFRRMRP